MNDLKLFGKNDLLIIAAVLFVCAVLFAVPRLGKSQDITAQVLVDGKVCFEKELSSVKEPFSYSPKENVEIIFADGGVFFSQSDCKGKQCISAGRLTMPGQTAACLPENVLIVVKGKSASATDAITY